MSDTDISTENRYRYFQSHSIVALLGPRQAGKTTLARQYAAQSSSTVSFFDLEDPTDRARIDQDAKLTLQDLKGLVVIDEIQLVPELFPLLRVLGDRHNADTQFLILGSASRDLIRQSSETLAGRIAYRELFPLSLSEIDNTASIAIDRSS
ncbi:MAG: AAA family ATPase [Bdellovibrionales bacterium]|nr:AAA family ATPase [Bdellovibrionales bacterium]